MLNPIHFLVAAERSGTTLLRLMLDHHPQIAFCSEFEYSVDHLAGERWPEVSRYVQWLKNDRVYKLHGWRIDETKSYPELLDSFLVQKRANKPIIGATVHRHFERLLKIWPHARFIYLVRDGRDVAKSRIVSGWEGNMFTAVDAWIDAEEQWKSLRSKLPPDRWMEVFYADLILHTRDTLARICGFLGTAYDPAMLDYPKYSSYTLPDPTKVTQWQRTLTEHDVRLAEARIAPYLEARGFSLSGLPLMRITSSEARRLRVASKLQKLRTRIRQDGLTLITLEMLSRRLHLRPIQKACARRIDWRINARLQ